MKLLSQLTIVVALAGCTAQYDAPLDLERTVETGLRGDLFTGVSADPDSPNYRFWISTDLVNAGGPVDWAEHARLVRWPSEEPVDGAWEDGAASDGLGGVPNRVLFRPHSSLPSGWYALQGRVDSRWQRGLRDAHVTTEDGWESVRAHVGSFPLLRLSFGHNTASNSILYLTPTEPVDFETVLDVATLVSFTVNGEERRCWSRPENPTLVGMGHLFSQVTLECDVVENGDFVEIMVSRDLRPTAGAFHSMNGESPPQWSFRMPRTVDEATDALFEERVSP